MNLRLRFAGASLYATLFLQAAAAVELAHLRSVAADGGGGGGGRDRGGRGSGGERVVDARFLGADVALHDLAASAGAGAGGADVWACWRGAGTPSTASATAVGYVEVDGTDEGALAAALDGERARLLGAGGIEAYPVACLPPGGRDTLRVWPADHGALLPAPGAGLALDLFVVPFGGRAPLPLGSVLTGALEVTPASRGGAALELACGGDADLAQALANQTVDRLLADGVLRDDGEWVALAQAD